jgi:hypothetical protein
MKDYDICDKVTETCEASSSPRSDIPADQPEQRLQIGGTLKGMVLLNLGALLFGSNQVVIKTTVEEGLTPIGLDALRFGAAALCFLPLLPRALKQPTLLLPALELGAWLTGAFTCALRLWISSDARAVRVRSARARCTASWCPFARAAGTPAKKRFETRLPLIVAPFDRCNTGDGQDFFAVVIWFAISPG